MTEIRWKNGGPLFIQPAPGGGPVGLVAVDQDCCCPPPPPPQCWDCVDPCSYFFELLLPENVSVKTPPVDCVQLIALAQGDAVNEFSFPSAVPSPVSPALQLSYSAVAIYPFFNQNSSHGFAFGGVVSVWTGEVAFDCAPLGNPDLNVNVVLSVNLYCTQGRMPTPVYATYGAYITTATGVVAGNAQCLSGWDWYLEGEFDIPVDPCQSAARLTCSGYTDPLRLINTPLTFTITKNGCNLGGSFSTRTGLFAPDAAIHDLVRTTGEAVRDAFSYTFRITSRPACRTIECECDALLIGLLLEFDGSGYTLGTEVDEWTSLGASEGIARRSYGSDSSWTVVHDETDGFNLEVFNRRQLDIYCETTVDGPVWRALIRTYCYDAGATGEDVWMGRFLCYETVCEDLENNRPLNGPIPQEEPVEVEYLGRTYFGTTDCTPPPIPAVRLGQVTSC